MFDYTVRNVDDRRARDTRVRVYLSNDRRKSGDDARVENFRFRGVAGHHQESAIQYRDWFPSPLQTVFVCVIAAGQAEKCREAPNTLTVVPEGG